MFRPRLRRSCKLNIEGAPARAIASRDWRKTTGKRKSGDLTGMAGLQQYAPFHRLTRRPALYRGQHHGCQTGRYLGHYLADVKSGVIYDAMATQATGTAEREAILEMLDRLGRKCASW